MAKIWTKATAKLTNGHAVPGIMAQPRGAVPK